MNRIIPASRAEMAAVIDHSQLSAFATQEDISRLCDEAAEYRFASVTVNSAWTSYCAKRLEGSGVHVNATIGFPLGATTVLIKVEEAREAIQNGATELDMVINIGAFKSGFREYVQKEIEAIVDAAGDAPVKVILETCYLTSEETQSLCEISQHAAAAFVKTSTGFGKAGATVEDVRLMRAAVGDRMGVKAAGGIRSYEDAVAMLDAGASRLGSSAGLDILAQMEA